MFYRVIVNDEGCYAIWPNGTRVPSGWRPTGFCGAAEAALNLVAELWRRGGTAGSARARPDDGPGS